MVRQRRTGPTRRYGERHGGLADNFAAASAPGYASLLAVHSALAGVSRERASALLRLRP